MLLLLLPPMLPMIPVLVLVATVIRLSAVNGMLLWPLLLVLVLLVLVLALVLALVLWLCVSLYFSMNRVTPQPLCASGDLPVVSL